MSRHLLETKQVQQTLFIFFGLLIAFSGMAYYAILVLNPTSIYVGALMMTPALAAFVTMIIKKRSLSELPWNLRELKYLKRSYLTPILYVSLAYALIWLTGRGNFADTAQIAEWGEELGMAHTPKTWITIIMTVLLLTVGVIKNLGSTLGEEIGWRGFLIYELRKIMSFNSLSIVSGVIWAVWHYPIIILMYRGSGNLLFHMATFSVMIIGISVILAYFTFRSNSLWPAAIFHSVHNIYIQKICSPLTLTNDNSSFWMDEYGLMIPIFTTLFAFYYWRKAAKENL